MLGGGEGVKYGVIVCFWSKLFVLLSEHDIYFGMRGYLWSIEMIEVIHIFYDFMTLVDECKFIS